MTISLIVGLIVLLIAATALMGRRIQQNRKIAIHLEEVRKRIQEKVQENTWNKSFIQEAEAIVNSYQRRKVIFRPVIESKDNDDS
jgi:ABC-type multidrug transport system fused ATPase/permease subunit